MRGRRRPRRFPGRRPFMRGGRGHPRGNPPERPSVPPALRRANRMLESGDHANAAKNFSQLAQEAEDRDQIHHASMLYLRAGHAYALAGQAAEAVQAGMKGLGLIKESGRWGLLSRAGGRFSLTLVDSGFERESAEVQGWLDNALSSHQSEVTKDTVSMRDTANLPAKCPYCGATIHPDEIEWLSNDMVECAYCGSTVNISK